jgi:hypothetical protein
MRTEMRAEDLFLIINMIAYFVWWWAQFRFRARRNSRVRSAESLLGALAIFFMLSLRQDMLALPRSLLLAYWVCHTVVFMILLFGLIRYGYAGKDPTGDVKFLLPDE